MSVILNRLNYCPVIFLVDFLLLLGNIFVINISVLFVLSLDVSKVDRGLSCWQCCYGTIPPPSSFRKLRWMLVFVCRLNFVTGIAELISFLRDKTFMS